MSTNPSCVVGLLFPAPRGARCAGKGKQHLVRSIPRPAPPEVRCLTPEVPARSGWGVLLIGVASAVAGFERARGAGHLVSGPGPGSGPGWGWSRDLDLSPSGLRGRRAPSAPSPAFGLSSGRRQAPARPLSESRPRLRRSQLLAFTGARTWRRPGSLSVPPLHPDGRPFLRCPELTLPGGWGAPGFQPDVPRPLPRGARRSCPPWRSCHRRCRLPGCAPQRLGFSRSRPHVPAAGDFCFCIPLHHRHFRDTGSSSLLLRLCCLSSFFPGGGGLAGGVERALDLKQD